MNILIIRAHPSSQGFTHKIARVYKKTSEKQGHQVDQLDLYAPENQQAFLSFEDIKNTLADEQMTRMQGKIKWADELVFVHPLWWLSQPAVMKNFIDSNFSLGFAYRYVKMPLIKGRPVGLLKGKSARVFVTCDGANWMYKLIATPHKLIMKHFVLQFCGVKCKSYQVFDRMRWSDDKKRAKRLKQVEKIACQNGKF